MPLNFFFCPTDEPDLWIWSVLFGKGTNRIGEMKLFFWVGVFFKGSFFFSRWFIYYIYLRNRTLISTSCMVYSTIYIPLTVLFVHLQFFVFLTDG